MHLEDQPGPVNSEQLDNFGYCTALEELRIVFAGDGTEQLLFGGFPNLWTTLTVCSSAGLRTLVQFGVFHFRGDHLDTGC
jgi:hypothetical protein